MLTSKPNNTINASRRLTLKAIGALPLISYGLLESLRGAQAASDLTCTLAPTMTEGPYWVDEKLNRADITSGTTRASVLNGVPLTLAIKVYAANGESCGVNPVQNVQIDIWHADAIGAYSDVSGNGQSSTVGQNFLRGYQTTDSKGIVNFTTIYPGWYVGRTPHIHVRARAYDASGNITYNFTTQLFFNETITDAVYANAPYNSRGTRDTKNGTDMHYKSVTTPIVINPQSKTSGGYTGEVAIGLSNLPRSIATVQGASFSAVAASSGSSLSPKIVSTLTVASADVGASGHIYVAAKVGNAWYFNDGSAWQANNLVNLDSLPAFFTGNLQSTHTLTVLENITISGLAGTELYVGYGKSATEMVQKQQYQKIYTL